MYSLGIIFYEVWAGFRTIIEKEKAFNLLKNNEIIESEYEKKMPPKAVDIIKLLVRDSPDERPSTLALLQR
jgi:hypothetical protein